MEGLSEGGAREGPSWETGERRRAVARFSDRMVPEVVQVFWAAMARGEFVTHAPRPRLLHRSGLLLEGFWTQRPRPA
jgi:hypothetical protein